MEKRARRILYPVLLAAFVLGIGAAAYFLMPWMVRIATDAAVRDAFLESLRDKGAAGVATLIGLVFLQVVVPVLPAEALEVGAGVLYGTLGGFLACIAGHTAGSLVNYAVGRWLGAGMLAVFVKPEKLEKARGLVTGARADLVVFLLYFIPGVPKDALAYAAGLSRYPFVRFLLLSTIARIPSVISSTFVGSRLAAGDTGMAVIVFAAVAVVAVPAFFFSERILKWIGKRRPGGPPEAGADAGPQGPAGGEGRA